jgi:tight adherence protein B
VTAALLAGAAVAGLIVLTGTGSASRLRSPVLPLPLWSWPAPRSRPDVAATGVDVPASLALELRSGRDLAGAFAAVAEELADNPRLASRLRAAGASAARGDPVRHALTVAHGVVARGVVSDFAVTDGVASALQVTAACCDVSVTAGLPLAEILDTVAEEARTRLVLVGRAKAELAGARSTSVVLACLPAVGLAMGQLLGARPVRVLLTTGWGAGCLCVALMLTGAGAAWSRAIRVSAERRLP